MADDGTQYSYVDLGNILLVNDRIYNHRTLRVNFTTYDMRRDYDIINPTKHANVLAVSPLFDPSVNQSDDGHPFVYARVLGIYHVDVIYSVPGTQNSIARTMEFLFVRWFQRDVSYKAGFLHRRLHRLTLGDAQLDDSFGFLDPDDIIRGCHLLPAFASGKATCEAPAPDPASASESTYDWMHYYVNL